MKRVLNLGIAAVIVGSLGLTAAHVSAATRASAGAHAPKLQHGINLTIWDGLEDVERPVEQQVANAWAKQYGDTVKVQTTADNKGKMCVGAPSGNGADIVGTPHDQVSYMQACGVLAPIPASAWSAAQKKTYIPAALKATTLAGKTYAMPWAIETTGMFYNKSLIPASNFKPASGKYLTWATLIPRLKKIAASKGVTPFGWDPANFYYDYAFISAYGGYVFKYSSKSGYNWQQLGLDSPNSIKGISFIGKLSNHGSYNLIQDSMTGSVGDGLFSKGQELVDWTGPWNEGNFTKANVSYSFAPLPAVDATHPMHPFSTIQVYSLNKYSKYPNEAASLLSYLTTHMQIPIFKLSGRIPVIKSLLSSKAVTKDPVAAGLAKAALTAQPIPNIPEMSQVWSPAGNAIGLVFKGQATASAAASTMTSQIKAAIAKEHSG